MQNVKSLIDGFLNKGTTKSVDFGDGHVVEYTYDDNGNRTKSVAYVDGEVEYTHASKYDEMGNETASEVYTNGTVITDQSEYDDAGNLIYKLTGHESKDESWTVEERYNTAGDMISRIDRDKDGNITLHQEAKIDKEGKLIKLQNGEIEYNTVNYNDADGAIDDELQLYFTPNEIKDICDKLKDRGVPINDDTIRTLADIMARFDFDMDKNENSKIDENENSGKSEYLNKDENGKPISTSFVDYIVNRYIHDTNVSQ
ncbi:MAG: hypothetical protein MJ237_07410 [bacterium]|nr:hypothetical protein [bacterium]